MISFATFVVCALACFSPAILISIGERKKARMRQREAAARLAAKMRARSPQPVQAKNPTPPALERSQPRLVPVEQRARAALVPPQGIHTKAWYRDRLTARIRQYKGDIAAELRGNRNPDRISLLCAGIRKAQAEINLIDAKAGHSARLLV